MPSSSIAKLPNFDSVKELSGITRRFLASGGNPTYPAEILNLSKYEIILKQESFLLYDFRNGDNKRMIVYHTQFQSFLQLARKMTTERYNLSD